MYMGKSPLLPKANQEDEPIKKMTADEALKAHIARFGFIPWGLPSLPDDAVVRAVEEALETGIPCEDGPLPPGCIL